MNAFVKTWPSIEDVWTRVPVIIMRKLPQVHSLGGGHPSFPSSRLSWADVVGVCDSLSVAL